MVVPYTNQPLLNTPFYPNLGLVVGMHMMVAAETMVSMNHAPNFYNSRVCN